MGSISVVLPVYNGIRHLEECVQSVLDQSIKDFKFIIIDDCSTDNSYDFLSVIKDDRIQLIRNEKNLGLFSTLNKLLYQTETMLIHLWSQDDIMKYDCLEKVIAFHERHPEVLMSYSNISYIDEHSKLINVEINDETPPVIDSDLFIAISVFYGSITGNIANVTLTSTALNRFGYFNEQMKVSADFEMWIRIGVHEKIGFINEPLIFLRRHQAQLSKQASSTYYFIEEDIEIYKILLGRLTGNKLKVAKSYFSWKNETAYFNNFISLLFKKEWNWAVKYFKYLASHSFVPVVACRWLFIRFLRLIKRDQQFYQMIIKKYNV